MYNNKKHKNHFFNILNLFLLLTNLPPFCI